MKKGEYVVKKYKVDEFTCVAKLNTGVEVIIEDYTKEVDSKGLVAVPQKVFRRLHPKTGRQDCHMVMSGPVKTKPKQLIGV
jgi:hypothetical protein